MESIVDQIFDFATSFSVDENACDSIRALLIKYISESLDMDYFHVMVDGKNVAGKPGLGTPKSRGGAWSNDDSDHVTIYDGTETSYMAQSTFAYLENKPIWITAQGTPLNQPTEYTDQWSNSSNERLPLYRNSRKEQIRTSVVLPIRQGDRHVFGFVCLETNQFLKIKQRDKDVLSKLADAIGAVLSGHEVYKRKITCTNSTLKRIQHTAEQMKTSFALKKPLLFIASSSKCDHNVMLIIRKILNKNKDKFDVHYWKDDKSSGVINEIIEELILRCRFGICYFSEPDRDHESSTLYFKDNPNVMFEAGMLQALCSSPVNAPIAWIPIREKNSPPPPFDFSHMRILQVQRFGVDDKDVDKEGFEENFEEFILDLLKKYPSH